MGRPDFWAAAWPAALTREMLEAMLAQLEDSYGLFLCHLYADMLTEPDNRSRRGPWGEHADEFGRFLRCLDINISGDGFNDEVEDEGGELVPNHDWLIELGDEADDRRAGFLRLLLNALEN